MSEEIFNFILNHFGSIMASSGGVIAVIMSVLEVSKIKINPWSWLAAQLGNALNANVMNELKETKSELKDIRTEQAQTQKKLDEHISKSEERDANNMRTSILRFNNELMRKVEHTEEDFNEILDKIDAYEAYCKIHPNYKNNKCKHAVTNIERVYDVLLESNGFLNED